MSNDGEITDEALRQLAAQLGLGKLAASHFDDLRKAYAFAQRITKPADDAMMLSDEPAHIYRAGKEA